ncbi:MAG: ABC transporter permease [Clostridiales Family XIII bacterium]|jgi:ABC-2 type transport system permease protein|nr:ABC transporter permease [Clostridiales Family XIII bacterium]
MRVLALARRILQQMRRDRRTLALMLIGPLLVLALMYLILDTDEQPVRIAVVQAPADYIERLDRANVVTARYGEADARQALRDGEVTAAVYMQSGKLHIAVDGANPVKVQQALAALENARFKEQSARPDLKSEVTYIYGYAGLSTFDNFGSVLIGFIVFFFVFLVSGISFLQERTTGTLEKLLSTPIRRWEIVCGYLLGFGFFTVLQSVIIVCFCVYMLKIILVGTFALVVLITLSGALMALTLGTLLSTAAQSEFQMMQFIPLVVVPQVFFSGLFDLSPQMEAIGRFMPLYYIAEALRTVMLKGGGFTEILLPLGVMFGMSLCFIFANIQLLKKHRSL